AIVESVISVRFDRFPNVRACPFWDRLFFCPLVSGRSPKMTQRELNRAVAQATGETVDRIERMGFGPLADPSADAEPLTIDWDEHEELRAATTPVRRRRLPVVA